MKTTLTAPLFGDDDIGEQIRLEREAITAGIQRYWKNARKSIERGEGPALKPAERLILHWLDTLTIAIRTERRNIAEGKPGQVGYVVYGPVLRCLPSRTLAAIAARVTLAACMKAGGPVPVARLTAAIGRDVLAEINLRAMRRDNRDALKTLESRFRELSPRRVNWWAKKSLEDPKTSRIAMARIGSVLLDAVVAYAAASDYNDDVPIPAFEESVLRRGVRTIKQVALTEAAERIIEHGHDVRATLRPRYLPMIVPPYSRGAAEPPGYVEIATPIISKPTKAQKRAMAESDMSEVFEGLTAIGHCGQRVNRRVLEVAEQVWKEGGGDLGIPPREDRPRPEKPAGYDARAPRGERWAAVDPEVKRRYKREAAEAIAEEIANKAAREDFLQKRYVAQKFASRPAIYFPHQLDFRGRAYPIPPHLNHQGDDLCRGLLEFAEAKPVGPREMYWVLGQAADSFGHDKMTFADRAQWTRDHMKLIERAAADPLNDEWWRTAKKPWQFLAACFALTSPEAAARLPIQRDGTANGLQWYAALARDPDLAAKVNMAGGDEHSDIYGIVAAPVRERVERDAANDRGRMITFTEKGQRVSVRVGWLAAHALPLVNRDITKPVLMPKPYGIKPVGARQGIGKMLKKAGLDKRLRFRLSVYLAGIIYDAVEETCAAATTIMDWLRATARTIAEAGHPVSWTTPMGFRVVQPYRNFREVRIKTILQDITLQVDDETMPVAVADQIDGFAPNLIHSFDACHMFRTATACAAAGAAMRATHDAFATHAATVETMDRVLREQFVAINRTPLLETLAAELRAMHPDLRIDDPPPRGDYDIEQVLGSPRFFS